MSDLHKKLQLSRLPPMPPHPAGARGGKAGGGKRGMGIGRRDYSPVTWKTYFEKCEDIDVGDGNTFRVYSSGSEGPVCFFLHGGGFSALSWACVTQRLTAQVKCRCVAVDMRGHGDTHTKDDLNLSAEVLDNDVRDVVKALYGDDAPPVILVGHSMGGAIGVHVAVKELLPTLIGLAVIDVVEGTALDALTFMQSFLRGRPSVFRSLEHAIEWCIRSGHVRNLDSAKVSMVGQLKKLNSNTTATSEISQNSPVEDVIEQSSSTNTIMEEDEEETESKKSKVETQQQNDIFVKPTQSVSESSEQYTWRIDLGKTEKFWRGWFEGLSAMFLTSSVPKMLLLAGVDRLDKELTVGHMQGKFQMQVLPQCGHAVHEDVPDRVADVLSTFMVRHQVAQPTADFERCFPTC